MENDPERAHRCATDASKNRISTREKRVFSERSKIYPANASCKESPSTSNDSLLSGFEYRAGRGAHCSEEVEQAIAARAVQMVVSNTLKGKTGIVGLCSMVGDILLAKTRLKHEVSNQNQEIKKLRAQLNSTKQSLSYVSNTSCGSDELNLRLKTAATQTKGVCKKLTVDKGTHTNHLAKYPKEADASSQTDICGSKSVCVSVTSQTDSCEEETDLSGHILVCTGCGTDSGHSSTEISSMCSETIAGTANDVEKKNLKPCKELESQSENLMVNVLAVEEQLKMAVERNALLERRNSVLSREVLVLRKEVSSAQCVQSQSNVKLPSPCEDFQHSQQQSEAVKIDVETFELLPGQPRSPEQGATNQLSSELPRLNSKRRTDQLIVCNNNFKLKGTKNRITRSKKILPVLEVNYGHQTRNQCTNNGWLPSRRPNCGDTLSVSGDSRNDKPTTHQIKNPRLISRPKVIPNVGDRVVVMGEFSGVVKYLGPIDNTSTTYVGLHLDAPVGKGNGTLNGTVFFNCPKNYCKFTPVDEVLCIVSKAEKNSSSSGVEKVKSKMFHRRHLRE